MRSATFMLVLAFAVPSDAWADDPPEGREFLGVTEPSAGVVVQSQATGYLTRIAVNEGDAVAQGDLLVEIDPRPYQLAVEAAHAGVLAAEARLKGAQIATAVTKRLFEKNVISQDELDLKLAADAEAEAALELAKIEVARAELTLSWTRITAPFNGRVSRILISQGALVTAGQTQVLSLVSTDPLHVSFNVPESILLQLRRQGTADPGRLNVAIGLADEQEHPHAAQLDLIEPEVDSNTASVRFQATLPNPDGLLSPGMSVRVRLTPAP